MILPNLLVAAFFVLTLGLGGYLLVALEILSRARWSVPLRRVPAAMTAAVVPGAVLLVLAALGAHDLYAWTHRGAIGAEPVLTMKRAWLSLPFWALRGLLYLVAWIGLGTALLRSGAYRLAAAFVVVFALTFNLASFDWFMSLEPHWYSTVYGVYHFAGLLLAATAAATALVVVWKRAGPLAGVADADRLHDLGRMLFAFSSFWIYIWFCQYMLIWYTNIPEEAAHFAARFRGSWEALFWLNPVLNWAVPFLVLLPRAAKRSESALLRVSLVLLLGRWLDLHLMVMPTFSPEPVLGAWEAASAALAAAVFLLAVRRPLCRS